MATYPSPWSYRIARSQQNGSYVCSKIDYFKSSQRINEIEDINKTSLSPTVISFRVLVINSLIKTVINGVVEV